MRFILILTFALWFMTWMNFAYAVTGPVKNCPCLSWSNTKVHFKRIKSYFFQREGSCLISAAVFKTKQRQTICSDPESAWAKRTIQRMGSSQEESATTTTASTKRTSTPSQKTTEPESSCLCLQWSNTQLRPSQLQNYTIQEEGTCSVGAIVFLTKCGKTICADPKSCWAKRAIQRIDRRKKVKC